MKLGIVGTGTMGKVLYEYASQEGTFNEIFLIEPLKNETWPLEKLDLLIDFSHPEAIYSIYDYCREQGGNIPVILATTGYDEAHRETIKLLEKICPIIEKTNFSKGVAVMNKLVADATEMLRESSDIRVEEMHHIMKKDAPSGTAKTLCDVVGITPEEYDEKVAVLRMGSIFGEHTVYFAMEDEVLEIRHSAYSKKIFAIGALEAGKKIMGLN